MKHSIAIVVLALTAAAVAQEPSADRLKIPLRDPSRPATVKVSLIHGGVTVKAYSGREILVEAVGRRSRRDRRERNSSGPRQLFLTSTGLAAEEENNVVSISTDSHQRAVDLVVQAPVKTSLKLSVINSGNIRVEGVDGEIEANAINGGITLSDVSGSVVAHSLNGTLTASIKRADPGKPMSFTSLNGKVDVTLPATIKADLKLKAGRGDVFSDFDVELAPSNPTVEQTGDATRGKYKVRTESMATGKINGGGQEITFKNMNGSIYIRKGQ
ncbi:MAG: hypothetical protein R2729_24995 [Bryobacteraceae bacterium]